MPRAPLKVSCRLETLSVLSPEGQLDATLEPKVSDADLRKLYKTMLAARRLDERCLMLQRQGRMGTYGPSKGQEAASLGAICCLDKNDWLIPAFREIAGMMWRGWPMHTWMLYWGGFEAGNFAPEGVNDLPTCVPIASQCQYGMGIAWGCKLRGKGQVAMAFCGDGATSEGDFHEAMNFAAVYNLPMIMVIQNNHWAISIPRKSQTAAATLAQKAVAYGMDGVQVDGNDMLAMITATREAIEKARTGGGPTLIEAVTYRLAMHTTADDPKKYRTEAEVREWEPRDPLPRFQNYLKKKGLLDDKVQQVIDEEIASELDQAVKNYESHKFDPIEFFDYQYAELTPDLARQKEELRAYLESKKAARAGHGAPAVSPAH